MKNKNISRFLKGKEGQKFYTLTHGYAVLEKVKDTGHMSFRTSGGTIILDQYGRLSPDGECVIFTSPTNKCCWEEWEEKSTNTHPPKTWEDYCRVCDDTMFNVMVHVSGGREFLRGSTVCSDIEKSAEAYLKISHLISMGYGGRVTKEEWKAGGEKYSISCQYSDGIVPMPVFIPSIVDEPTPIAFHTWEQAEEFLTYNSNLILLHDYFLQW